MPELGSRVELLKLKPLNHVNSKVRAYRAHTVELERGLMPELKKGFLGSTLQGVTVRSDHAFRLLGLGFGRLGDVEF